MEIRHLKYFLGVAEELNFGRAAEKMHISQPPLSRQIMDLEEDLGVKLFDRTARGVELTEAGNYLVVEAQKLLGLSERIRERITQIGTESARRIRLGFVGSTLYSFLPELMRRCCSEVPGISFELRELASEEQANALIARSIDVGFARSWVGGMGVEFQSLVDETLSIVSPPAIHRLDSETDLPDFANLPFVAFSMNCAPGIAEIAQRICLRAGFSPRTIFVANQYDAVLRLVAAGLGWTIAPTMAVTNARLGENIAYRELLDLPERIAVGMIRRADEDCPWILDFIESVHRFFGETGSKG